ncbi:hypothetical protein [Halopseudomonas sp.]|uniref:hypothetical protein n=1 Tax=Halopseudomonas sp. TaxID=2901191 RepID=UPI0035698134
MSTSEPLTHSIDCRWLLALYAIIPACLLAIILDALLLDGQAIHRYLPDRPEQWPFWTVIFGLPHIIASLLTMADREYLSFYRRSLFWPLLLFAAITSAGHFGPQPVSYDLLLVILAFYTIYHVLAQQLGLTLMMMGTAPTRTFKFWKWTSILAGFAIYINVYGQQFIPGSAIRVGGVALTIVELFTWIAALLCAAQLVLALRLAPTSRHRMGVWYLWSNVALIISALLINHLGYTLFVILIPRVIHDLTAYTVYITHDRNRNRHGPVNLFYRLTGFSRLSPLLLLPALSIAIAFVLSSQQHYPVISIAILTMSFLHYYFEGFIWRGPNPHRNYVNFIR